MRVVQLLETAVIPVNQDPSSLDLVTTNLVDCQLLPTYMEIRLQVQRTWTWFWGSGCCWYLKLIEMLLKAPPVATYKAVKSAGF
jgi:hypothetical protein